MDQFHVPRETFWPVEQPALQDVQSAGLKVIILFSIRWFRRICFLFLCSFSIIGYVYSTYGKMRIKVHMSFVAALTDQVAYFLMTLSILATSLILLQFERNKQQIFKVIRYISSKTTTKSMFGVISYVIINAICVITFGLFMYFLMRCFGWDVYRYFVCRDIKFALINMALYLNSEVVYSIKCMFFDVNQELLSVYEIYLKNSPSTSNMDGLNIFTIRSNQSKIIPVYKKSKCLSVLKKITKKHNELCCMMDDFNILFGRATFTSIVSVVGNMLWALTILVEFRIYRTLIKLPLDAEISGIASNVAWILTMTGQIVLMGVIGGALTTEGQNTSTYCYQLLDQLSLQKDDPEEVRIKTQLILLAKQAEARCPVFSAWGFYSINLHILGMVVSNIFAFAIVAIQFMLNEL